jgi:hypothetical protein
MRGTLTLDDLRVESRSANGDAGVADENVNLKRMEADVRGHTVVSQSTLTPKDDEMRSDTFPCSSSICFLHASIESWAVTSS